METKVALITGASSGIGLEIAQTLLSRGYSIVASNDDNLLSIEDVFSSTFAIAAFATPCSLFKRKNAPPRNST